MENLRRSLLPEIMPDGRDDVERFKACILYIRKHCGGSALMKDKPWEAKDVQAVRNALVALTPHVHPNVRMGFWDNALISSLYNRIGALKLPLHVNPLEAEAAGLLHNIGIAVQPKRDEVLTDSVLKKAGVRDSVLALIPRKRLMLGLGGITIDRGEDMTLPERVFYMFEDVARFNEKGKLITPEELKARNPVIYNAYYRREVPPEGEYPSERAMKVNQIDKGRLQIIFAFGFGNFDWFDQTFEISLAQIRSEVEQELEKPENEAFLDAISVIKE